MGTGQKIFISHASADRRLADLLRDTMVLGGVPGERIFYSSSRSSGIAIGSDVRARLRTELHQAGPVVELLTHAFFGRPMCLMELGGAWALEKPTYPIVVPPLTRAEVSAHLGDVHTGLLGTPADIADVFDELHDRLDRDTRISVTATQWNPVARQFMERLPSILASLDMGTRPSEPNRVERRSASPVSGQTKVRLHNYDVVLASLGTEVQGEATNEHSVEHSASIKATFYDERDRIIGTAEGVVAQLMPGETKTFSLVSAREIPQYARLKVQVDAVF